MRPADRGLDNTGLRDCTPFLFFCCKCVYNYVAHIESCSCHHILLSSIRPSLHITATFFHLSLFHFRPLFLISHCDIFSSSLFFASYCMIPFIFVDFHLMSFGFISCSVFFLILLLLLILFLSPSF